MFEIVLLARDKNGKLERDKNGKLTHRRLIKSSDKGEDLWWFLYKNTPKSLFAQNGIGSNDFRKEKNS